MICASCKGAGTKWPIGDAAVTECATCLGKGETRGPVPTYRQPAFVPPGRRRRPGR